MSKAVKSFATAKILDPGTWTFAELFNREVSVLGQQQLSLANFGGGDRRTATAAHSSRPRSYSWINRATSDPSLSEYKQTVTFTTDVICDSCSEPVEQQLLTADLSDLTREFNASPTVDWALCNCSFHLKCLSRLDDDRHAILSGQWLASSLATTR